MQESRMMAEVAPPGCCAIWKVRGSRIATPFAPPSPGSTPISTPRLTPASISIRLNHVRATAKPHLSEWISCMRRYLAEAEQGFDRTLGQRHLEPDLEHEEEDDHHADGHRGDLGPRVLAKDAHEERDEDRRGLVDAER